MRYDNTEHLLGIYKAAMAAGTSPHNNLDEGIAGLVFNDADPHAVERAKAARRGRLFLEKDAMTRADALKAMQARNIAKRQAGESLGNLLVSRVMGTPSVSRAEMGAELSRGLRNRHRLRESGKLTLKNLVDSWRP